MKLEKIIPARKKIIEFGWVRSNFMKMDDNYRRLRSKFKNQMIKCGWCGYDFLNGDTIGLASPKGKTNMVLCQECCTQAKEGSE